MTTPPFKAGPTAKRFIVSEFATVSWSGARIEVISRNSGVKFATDNFDILRILHAFAIPKTVQEVIIEFESYEPEELGKSIDELIEAEILIETPAREPAKQYHWDGNALAFHWSSRQPSYHNEPRDNTELSTTPRSPKIIPLVPSSTPEGRDLIDVLDARRSWRSWQRRPIHFETFSKFLWLSARNRVFEHKGAKNKYISRPYPSGGAAYSLDLYPVIAPWAVESITAGLYKYLPDIHSIQKISEKGVDYLPFLEAAGRSAGTSAVPILIVITSRFARQGEMYGHLAYSLVLKEVGCLFQTFYLVGEYLKLAPCALGGGTPIGLLARLCGTSELAEPVVGEFMIGGRSELV
jgi:SagB-type dehydrogenase family enzyme